MASLRTFSTLGCPELTLDACAEIAVRHGVAALELRALGGTVNLPAYLASIYNTPAAFAQQVRERGWKIAALGTSLKLVGAKAGDRENFLEFVPWAEAAGVGWLRVFDGGAEASAAELSEAAETWRWWSELKRECGWRVDMMVETHDSLFTVAALQRFRAGVPAAYILWDTHHTWRRGGESPAMTWAAIRERVVHLHFKDSVSRPSAKHPYTYVLPGTGEFPIGELQEVVRRDAFSGQCSLEWERLWHPQLPPLEEALEALERNGWWI